ncbi:MAG: TauD/TfdA family dioxygenase [Acidimicrobiales bacterium]
MVEHAQLQAGPDRVTVSWPDGTNDEFSYLWLRDNCRCPSCREPSAWERLFDTVTMPLDLAPHQLDWDAGLVADWPDGHRTTLPEQWLRAHAYRPTATPAEVSWGAETQAAPPEISLAEIDSGPAGLRRWLELIDAYGFCLVRDVPTDIDAVLQLAGRIAEVQPSNFGRSFQVRSQPDPQNLAYTAHRLLSHTDIVNRHSAVNLQFLHCLQVAAQGGESILVDGFAAARQLADTDLAAHQLLCETPVPWCYQDDTVEITNHFPVIGRHADGRYHQIRFHTGLMAPLDLAPERLTAFYRALAAFGALLREPGAEYRFQMRPGDCQVFDNTRVLHARAAFDPNSGPRHLHGCYIDRDDFLGRLRALRRSTQDFRS